MGFLTTTADVDSQVALTDGMVQAVEGEVSILGPNDQAQWQGVYAGWGQVKTDWAADKAGSVLPGSVYGQGILDRCAQTQGQCAAFTAKIKGAGGNPAPGPVAPVDPSPSPIPGGAGGSTAASIAGNAATIVVIGGILYVVHTALSLFGVLPKKK